MKVLVVSDTHRRNENYFKAVELEKPDMVIHCGDSEGGEYLLTRSVECPVYIVMGNNDYFSTLPKELELDVGSYKVWVTHGHNYYAYMNSEHLRREAFARGMDIVMYGHTHKPVVERSGNVTAVNPGSLSYPRQEGRRPSYVVMELDENNELSFQIKYL